METTRTLPDARPIPLPVQLAVAGTSFRQDAVATAFPDERVTVRWVPHPKDEWACEVRGADHRLLGYIPAALNERVVARLGADSVMVCTVAAVVGSETLGLRITAESVVAAQDADGAALG